MEFSSEYYVPFEAAYIVAVCAPETATMTLSVYDELDSLLATTTCTSTSPYPGKVWFGVDGDADYTSVGSRIVSDEGLPFYVYMEDTDIGAGDEKNVWGAVQSRKYSSPNPSYALGEQELIAPPNMIVNSTARRMNNTGLVDISLDISDASNDGCKVKVEYVATSTCDFTTPLDPTIATGSATAIYGSPAVDNSEEYQIGTTSAWIDTYNGTNTLAFSWDSNTDVPSADGWYCLRLTVSDGAQATSATSTLYIDNVAPTAPGYLTVNTKNHVSVTFDLGTTTTEANFDQYKIFYKIYDGFSVEETDTLFGSSSDANLGAIDFNSATTTYINGLSQGTTYTFNIWAYDDYGNRASSSAEINVTPNRKPTGVFNSAVEKDNGSGRVDISIEVDDDDNDTCRARIDYVATSTCDFTTPLDPTIDTDNISTDFGTVQVDNNETYQVGTTSYYIITAAGSNTVNFDWLSNSDIPSANDTYCLRLTVYDGIDDQESQATTTLTIDNVAPTAPGTLGAEDIDFTSFVLKYATTTPATDTNEPGSNAYRVFYTAGTSGVTENDDEYDHANFNAYDYGGATSSIANTLTASTSYVFNIWAYDTYGNKASATSELTLNTRSYLENDSLTFTNPESSGTTTNIAVADGETEWNFRAVVSDADGYAALNEVEIRLSDQNDNSLPYDDLKFKWTESIDNFSETGSDASNAASISGNSSSNCSANTCTLDFKLIFEKTFATSSVDYNVSIYSTDDSAREDNDAYSSIYQVRKNWLKQIHYRWRNDDGGG